MQLLAGIAICVLNFECNILRVELPFCLFMSSFHLTRIFHNPRCSSSNNRAAAPKNPLQKSPATVDNDVVAAAPWLRRVVGEKGGRAAARADWRKPPTSAVAVAPEGAHEGGGLATCECNISAGKPAACWLPSQAGHTPTPRSRSRVLSSVGFSTAAGGVYHSLVRRLWCRWFILELGRESQQCVRWERRSWSQG